MWRRALPSLASLSRRSSTSSVAARFFSFASSQPPPLPPTTPFPVSSSPRIAGLFSSGKNQRTKVEHLMPIATGHEREEIQADLEGRNILEINYPVGPFGTKEAPAIVRSVYDKRIVGCPGGEAEDEHDVVWFWLEKGKHYDCPVCSQCFKLEVIGNGGSPDGHGDGDH